MDILIGIFGGGLISFIITYILGNQQLKDLKRLHKRQLEFKRDLHDQQLDNDRDMANLILRSLRYKEEHPTEPLPLIDKNMNLIFEIHEDEHLHFDDTDHLFSWDNDITSHLSLPIQIEE
jgi:hypothetical protein